MNNASMTPERWRQIKALLQSAMELDAEDRCSYLDRACAGDEELRSEVEAYRNARPGTGKDLLAGTAVDAVLQAMDTDSLPPTQLMTFSAEQTPLAFGVVIDGRYRVERELSRGGFGVVYIARDTKLHDKQVVIKVLLDNDLAQEEQEWVKQKFQSEVEILSRVDHPHIVHSLDVGQLSGGELYFVMQYVSGVTLRSAMSAQGITLERVAKLVRQIGQALAAAHEQGVVHRDLKPENIMIQNTSGEEYVKLIDFGIATVRERHDLRTIKDTKVVGTISYMAPEQVEGKPVAASDIYSIGVIAYEMVTGRRPLDPESVHQLLDKSFVRRLIKPCVLRPTLPLAAQEIILKALSFDARNRFSNALDFSEKLAQALSASVIPPVAFDPFSFVLFGSACALATVIAIRFLRGTPDSIGIVVSMLLSVSCLIVGCTFTQSGRHWLAGICSRLGFHQGIGRKFRFVFSFILLAILCMFYRTLPSIARFYQERGVDQSQRAESLPSAIKNYERASSLNPDYAAAYYNLGSAYEDNLQFAKAITAYEVAKELDPFFYHAHNNLGRLYLKYSKDSENALDSITRGLDLNPPEPLVNYSLYKNRGWARFNLETYELAAEDLRTAIALKGDGASAYCLLAKTIEAQGNPVDALPYWAKCLAYEAQDIDVERNWVDEAKQRLHFQKKR